MKNKTEKKVLVKGEARGAVLKSDMPINFLGMVDKESGIIKDESHELYGKTMNGRILAFPSGVGSSVGAYTIYSIKSSGSAPLAMICQKADITVATGCALADIPLIIIPEEEFSLLRDGKEVILNTEARSGNVISYVDNKPDM